MLLLNCRLARTFLMTSNEIYYNNPSDLFSLKGKVCLLTGAAGFLGRQMAAALAAAGGFVYLNGRQDGPLAALCQEIHQQGGQCNPLPFDITDATAMTAALRQIEQQHGHLDVLVNNAYAGRPGKFSQAGPDDFMQACESGLAASAGLVNASCQLLQARATPDNMSSVINIASMYGMVSPDPSIYGDSGHDNPPGYGAMKAALIQYTRYAATSLASANIRVNALSPGAFPADSVRQDMPELWQRLNQKPPMRRTGQPHELQGALVFLASSAASYVTGSNLVVDGGWTAW